MRTGYSPESRVPKWPYGTGSLLNHSRLKSTHRRPSRQRMHQSRKGSPTEGRPATSSVSRLPATDRSCRATLTRPLGRTHGKKGTDMSHYDRFTPQASVSPTRDISNTRAATFPTERRVIHSSTASLRHPGKVHHRVCAMRTICSSDEQNRLFTGAMKRISENSRLFDTGCRRQYRGRRRHGPAWQVFQMA